MMKRWVCGIFFLTCLMLPCRGDDRTHYIDPTIGNAVPFLVPTYPTVHLPNQMLRMFPVKSDYLSDQVSAFPMQVVIHRDPGLVQMRFSSGEVTPSSWKQAMTIDHDLEVNRPWFYSTYLIDRDIDVAFAPGRKCAVYRLKFPAGSRKNILMQGTGEMIAGDPDDHGFAVRETLRYKLRGIEPSFRETQVYFHVCLTDADGRLLKVVNTESEKGRLALSVPESGPDEFFVRYGVSYISAEQAKENYDLELGKRGFDELVADGKAEWESVVDQIVVEGGTEAQRRTFYTSLYRTRERMVDINEGGKYYSGYSGKVEVSERPFYVDDWVWDTFRAMHPLNTILSPEMENDFLHSYAQMTVQSGTLPTFPQLHGNHLCMNCYHSAAIFLDGYRKGLRDYDVEAAYEGIRKSLTEETMIPWRQGYPKREIDDCFHEKGFFPALRPGEKETDPMVDGFEKRQSVAVTLGMSYDFWALAQMAKDLGKTDDFEKFSKVGQNYRNLWHEGQRLFMPKDENGEWIDIDPKLDGGKGFREYYDENNGWTYAWDVQHDVPGLVSLLGGNAAAEARLDQLFREPLGAKKNQFYINGSNSTGLVGQFSMGNEPSFHIPYLYNYCGAPWKTQKRTRFLLDVWFKDNIFGIPGDEDGGGMTAFVVLSSLGIYPVTPGIPVYTITSPVFEKSTISLEGGKSFTIIAKGASKRMKYIQKAFINGEEIDSPFISHKQIMAGATLELILGEKPNKSWGCSPDGFPVETAWRDSK